MATIQQQATALMQTSRPSRDLGDMTGDAEQVKAMALKLVATFSGITEVPLVLRHARTGHTDCETFVAAPLDDPEGYLVVEHELSHLLFGTNMALTTVTIKKIVERLLRRANLSYTNKGADPYRDTLHRIVQSLWNLLEDHRCCFLWKQLYPGGGGKLQQRWADISKYELGESAKTDLVSYIARRMAGVETHTAPESFRNCGPVTVAYRNLVEGVDAKACLALTARFIDDIADELMPPPPKPKTKQSSKGGGGGTSGKRGGKQGGSRRKTAQSRQAEAKQKLKDLTRTSASSPPATISENSMGTSGEDPTAGKKKVRISAADRHEVAKLMTADTEDHGEGSSLAHLMRAGAERMEEALEKAKAEIRRPKGDKTTKQSNLTAAAAVCGIPSLHIKPTRPLPAASSTAYRVRQQLEKVRMKKKRKIREEGSLDVELALQSEIRDDFEPRVYRQSQLTGGLEILALLDVSGSMCGQGLGILDQALADIETGCSGPTIQLTVWLYSQSLFFMTDLGSTTGCTGVRHGGTNTVQALDTALTWAKANRSGRAIILATDGYPTSCRATKSSGDPVTDLQNVLEEARQDKIVLSALGVAVFGQNKAFFETLFGVHNFGSCSNIAELKTALPDMCQALVTSHINRKK